MFERNNRFDHVLDVLKLIDDNLALLEIKSDIHDTSLLSRVVQHLFSEGAFDKLVFILNYTAKRNLFDVHEFASNKVSSSPLNEHQM